MEQYVEMSWAAQEYARGCYAGYFPPGVWSDFGPELRAPVGRVHWAGTETATEWNGYLDGAIRSGHRVATEVIAAAGAPVEPPGSGGAGPVVVTTPGGGAAPGGRLPVTGAGAGAGAAGVAATGAGVLLRRALRATPGPS